MKNLPPCILARSIILRVAKIKKKRRMTGVYQGKQSKFDTVAGSRNIQFQSVIFKISQKFPKFILAILDKGYEFLENWSRKKRLKVEINKKNLLVINIRKCSERGHTFHNFRIFEKLRTDQNCTQTSKFPEGTNHFL